MVPPPSPPSHLQMMFYQFVTEGICFHLKLSQVLSGVGLILKQKLLTHVHELHMASPETF